MIASGADGKFVFPDLYKPVPTIEPLSAVVFAPDPDPEPPTRPGHVIQTGLEQLHTQALIMRFCEQIQPL
jgi:hypothetical protein